MPHAGITVVGVRAYIGLNVWPIWLLLAILATISAVGLAVATTRLAHDRHVVDDALSGQPTVPTELAKAAPTEDFTLDLPGQLEVGRYIAEIHRAADAYGLQLIELSVGSEALAAPDRLARSQFTLRTRGSYLATRAALSQVLNRFANVSVQQLRMRNDPAANSVESTIVLSVVGAPRRDTRAAGGQR